MLHVGLTASVDLSVTDSDTAAALGSGDVPVLATPRLIALCEAATLAAVSAHLDAGHTTVGSRVEIDHLAPSAVGAHITATATLAHVDRHRLVFSVAAVEGSRKVAEGTVYRTVVDRQRFIDRT
jgi:predicted thioesterase